jgi:PAS domain S-box-containing protein
MTGYSRDQVVGGNPRILQSGVHPPEFYERLWGTILSGRTFRAVMTNRRQDGTLYDEDQTITPIRAPDGTIVHFVSTGRDITHRRRAQEALQRLNQQLEREAARIAGILHDEAGQFLTSAHITLADLCEDAAPAVRERLLLVRVHLDCIEQRLREISHEIHPRIVEDLGLRDAVTFYAESFSRRTGIRVTLESLLESRYDTALESLIYRVVQEALTNVNRHAHAGNVAVDVMGGPDRIVCSVRDDGQGFEPAALCARGVCSLGLHVMQDRLEAVGGTLEIISAPGQGTEIRATVPVGA